MYTACRQWYKYWHTVFFIEFRRTAWLFPLFFRMTFLSSVFEVWTTWAVRWTGCWGKMKSVSYWGNRQAVQATPSPVIYRLSWRHQELKSLSRQVTHKQRQQPVSVFSKKKFYLCNKYESLYNIDEEEYTSLPNLHPKKDKQTIYTLH